MKATMKNYTDEKVAKAFGWKRRPGCWERPNGSFSNLQWLPKFTTDPTAIMNEFEKRGLAFDLWFGQKQWTAYAFPKVGQSNVGPTVCAETIPMVLCIALMAHLKNNRRK